MKFSNKLLPATFLKRKSERLIEASNNTVKLNLLCPNNSMLINCAVLGSTIWYTPTEYKPNYIPATWQCVEVDNGNLILVNNNICYELFKESILNNKIQLGDMEFCKKSKNEIQLIPDANLCNQHFFDFAILDYQNSRRCYINVVSSTLNLTSVNDSKVVKNNSYFPEASFSDNRDELFSLVQAKLMGHRAILCCFVLCEEIDKLYLTDQYNPEYAKVLQLALNCGVEFMAYGIKIHNNGISVYQSIPIEHDFQQKLHI